jgi:hypothetical protein
MKIIKDEKLITRNAKIGQYASVAGIVTIIGVTFFLIQSMSNPETVNPNSTWIMLAVLLVSMIISQVSMYFGTRWGRRPDEALDKALKGTPGDFTLYHYTTPVPHLLVGPSGIWLLLPYFLRGKITYKKNRWHIGGGGFAQGYLRLFGQESIGRPDLEVGSQAASLEKFLKKKLQDGGEIPPISAVLVFLDDNVEIQVEDAPLPTLQVKKLKEFLRKAAKETPFPPADLARVKAALAED